MLQLVSISNTNTLLYPSLDKKIKKEKKILSVGKEDNLPEFWQYYLQRCTACANVARPENLESQFMTQITI